MRFQVTVASGMRRCRMRTLSGDPLSDERPHFVNAPLVNTPAFLCLLRQEATSQATDDSLV